MTRIEDAMSSQYEPDEHVNGALVLVLLTLTVLGCILSAGACLGLTLLLEGL